MAPLRAGVAATLVLLFPAAAALADCPPTGGERVILAADGSNPDVFVWDSQARLADYVSGRWDDTKDVMAHTMLVPAGTVAAIIRCRPHAAKVQYEDQPFDVYGVKLLTGRHRARYGWVISSDAHAQREAHVPNAR